LAEQKEKYENELAAERKKYEDIIKGLDTENSELNAKIEEAEKFRREKQKFLD